MGIKQKSSASVPSSFYLVGHVGVADTLGYKSRTTVMNVLKRCEIKFVHVHLFIFLYK